MYQVVACALEDDIRIANGVDDSGKARLGQDDVNSATSNVHVNVGIAFVGVMDEESIVNDLLGVFTRWWSR